MLAGNLAGGEVGLVFLSLHSGRSSLCSVVMMKWMVKTWGKSTSSTIAVARDDY